MKKIIALLISASFLSMLLSPIAFAGWKESYKTKYSKRQLDPNSEKAKRLKRLCNLDFKYLKWTKTPKERKSLGEEPKPSLSAHLMPWKKEKDKFEGFVSNVSPGRRDLSKEERVKCGYTLSGCIKNLGQSMGIETSKMKESAEEKK